MILMNLLEIVKDLMPDSLSRIEKLALARACEESPIEGLFRSDHYGSVMGRTDRGSLDAWATISGLAAVTSGLRLGTLVSPATFRHPSVLAKNVVTAGQSARRVIIRWPPSWSP